MVLGMEHKLQQVFLNLFLNAQRRDAEGRLAVDQPRASRTASVDRRSVATRARAFRANTSRASTIRSSRRRRSARAPASACRSPTASCASTKARSTARAAIGQGTRFILSFPPVRAERPALAVSISAGLTHGVATVPSWSSTTKRSCGRSSRRCSTREGYTVRLAVERRGRARARAVDYRSTRRSST